MNRAAFRLWLCGALITVSACGIEGSGVTGDYPITSAGAVTELGSILVNGVAYDLAGASITIDGLLASESDLEVGSVVIVEGTVYADGESGKAMRVTAGNAVRGPIDFVDISYDGFTVLGQAVKVDAETVIENAAEGLPLGGLTLGGEVEVSGFADSSGVIRARHIGRRPADRPLLLTGYVMALDVFGRRFVVNGATVDYSAATLDGFISGLVEGAPVRVTASEVDGDGVIKAEVVTYRDLRMPGTVGDAAALQGWVTRYVSPSDFDVDGRRVVGVGAVAGVALDAFVAVDGRIAADGIVDVTALLEGGPAKIWVKDVEGTPVEGALVTITDGGARYEATTDRHGIAWFPSIAAQTGWATFSISAPGFDTETFVSGIGPGGYIGLTLEREGDWAIGRPIVLGTTYIDRASDGSTMTFSIDLAVIDQNSEAIQTLIGAEFSIDLFDCGWGGGRDCASDANGEHTGNWAFGGHPQSFLGLQPPMVRRPYLVEVLAVKSDRYNWRDDERYWETLAPALKSFAAVVGGNDSLSLSSIQFENDAATYTPLGPFTNDGGIYFDVIDQLALPAGHDWPPIADGLSKAIQRAADARELIGSDIEASVLVLGQPGLTLPEVAEITALAQQLGVRVSTVDYWGMYGVPEVSVRTGGFVAQIADTRQFPMVFGALDPLLAGSVPFYRMEFELTGQPGTFVAGGNAKVRLGIDVPTSFQSKGIQVVADVAIP